MKSMTSSSSRSRSTTDTVLKALGALLVLWAAAKVIGWLLSPGLILLAVALWLVVRSQRKAQKPQQVNYFVPQATAWQGQPHVQAMNHQAGPTYTNYSTSPAQSAPSGYWMPTAAPTGASASVPPTVSAPILDHRTQAERDIEDYVERSWPNV